MKRLRIPTPQEAGRGAIKTSGPFKLELPKANINLKIAELMKQDKGKMFTSTRLTVINTITSEVRISAEMPALLNFKDLTLTFSTNDNTSL